MGKNTIGPSRKPEFDYSSLSKRARLDLVRHPAILDLDGVRIGPLFPRDEGADIFQGMRGQPRRATKKPLGDEYREKRRKAHRYNV